MVMIDNIQSIIFLWTYMIIIWVVVITTWINKPESPNKTWKAIFMAFFLLAFGDSFHLLPRTYLWYLYSFQNQIDIYTSDLGIAIYGIGLIFTGITMTFFYLEFYYFWKEEYLLKHQVEELSDIKNNIKKWDNIAIGSVITRIILILLPWNNWGSEPDYVLTIVSFRWLTNLPLYIIGIEVLYLFWISPRKESAIKNIPEKINKSVKNSAYWILVSYICYSITLAGVPVYPMFGMFMIPKTIAYIVIVYYLYKYILTDKNLISN